MRVTVLLGCLLLVACEGQVGEPGDVGPQGSMVVIRDRSGPELVTFACTSTSVVTRETFSCSLEARHPAQETLRCTVTPGDGAAPIDLGDCTTAKSTPLVFSSPGAMRIGFSALDPQGRGAARTLTVSVTGLPNQPPRVDAVSATAMTGKAPLVTTLRWQVADPEGDAVTCAVDVGADGSVEHAAVPCGSFPLTLRTVGTVPVRVVATDSGGLSSEQVLQLQVSPPTVDLRIASVEYGQTVLKPDLELVQDKPALLRVNVIANEGGQSTAVQVEAKANGTSLGVERLAGPAVVPSAASPGDLNASFRMLMPRTWLVPGLELTLKVDPDDTTFEADESDNVRTLTPRLSRDHVLHLTTVPITTGDGQTGQPLDLSDHLVRVYPLKDVDLKVRAPYTSSVVLSGSDVGTWNQVLGELASLPGLDGSARAYYGLVRSSFGGIAGLGFVGQHASIGIDSSTVVGVHELGHNFGLQHAPCGPVGGADSQFPYPNGAIGTWGVDGLRLLSPQQADVMGYCSGSWVSDYHYEKVQRHVRNGQAFDPTVTLPMQSPEDALFVSGRIVDGRAVLSPVFRVRAPPMALAPSETQLRLSLADGRSLVVPVQLAEPGEGGELHFSVVIPWPGAVARAALLQHGTELGVREAGRALLARASLERVDARTVRVRFPADAFATVTHVGSERTTLTIGATGGVVTLRTDGLEGGHFDVSLSTGLETALLSP